MLLLPLQAIIIFAVIGLYRTTGNILMSSIAMGVSLLILKLFFLPWMQAIFLGILVTAVAYGMFRLALYFEDSVLLGVLTYVMGAILLLIL